MEKDKLYSKDNSNENPDLSKKLNYNDEFESNNIFNLNNENQNELSNFEDIKLNKTNNSFENINSQEINNDISTS